MIDLEIAIEALERIAAFYDTGANAHLEKTGSYSLFDEPGSVRTAREALLKMKRPAEREPGGQV
jgi:hypothetical protein